MGSEQRVRRPPATHAAHQAGDSCSWARGCAQGDKPPTEPLLRDEVLRDAVELVRRDEAGRGLRATRPIHHAVSSLTVGAQGEGSGAAPARCLVAQHWARLVVELAVEHAVHRLRRRLARRGLARRGPRPNKAKQA